ncbi:hypothetical protein GCM10009716_17830 [Streptomyces sodiiphilus]|uniref:DUF7848 domain-containing protein n=1 Tax=Streptomyces sodiiphilus TaxID=226217 RepID=A0ABN2P130_9ACTN
MTRGWIGRRRWAIGPDTEPDREPEVYAVECAVCRARSSDEESERAAQDWIFEHARYRPAHHTYRLSTVRPWRAVMVP